MDANLINRLVEKKLGCNTRAGSNLPRAICDGVAPARKAICHHASGKVLCNYGKAK